MASLRERIGRNSRSRLGQLPGDEGPRSKDNLGMVLSPERLADGDTMKVASQSHGEDVQRWLACMTQQGQIKSLC